MSQPPSQPDSELPDKIRKGATVRKCVIEITGQESPKDLAIALPRLSGDDKLTLTWNDTGDFVSVMIMNTGKKEFCFIYESPQNELSFWSPFNGQTTISLLNAFKEPDCSHDKFRKMLADIIPETQIAKVLETIEEPKSKAILFNLLIVVLSGLAIWALINSIGQKADERATPADAQAIQKTHDVQAASWQPPPNYNPNSNSEYKSVLGRLNIGQALYTKNTHAPFGFVVDIDWGFVWVADSYSTKNKNLQLNARKYPRSFITDNFETK